MKANFGLTLFVALGLMLSGCGHEQVPEPTMTSLPTTTLAPTATLTQTNTPVPTNTLTPIPISLVYNPVPRWMILEQPFYDVEILGETWTYANDRWGDTYGCISYTREKEPYLFFEECFALTQSDLTFESQRDAFLSDDYEVLTPSNSFGDVGQISLMAKRLKDNSTEFIKFFELIGIEEYILLVEMNAVTDDTSPLQVIYEDQAASVIDYALKNMLEKSRLITRPTATPLSPTQEKYHATLAQNLISEIEASTLYAGTWEAIGDFVDSEGTYICRDFEDRTNADVMWVQFSNCIQTIQPDFELDNFVSNFMEPDDVILESRHQYDDKLILIAYQSGHTFFNAWMIHEEYLYFMRLESRTLAGQKVEDVFTDNVDDFIYSVLMTNADK